MSRREIDRRVGWTENYLSQILRGAADLKMVHVVEVLRVLRIEPEEFLRRVFSSPKEEESPSPRLNDLQITVIQHEERLKALEEILEALEARLKQPWR